jgi:hypothetical protein
MPHRIEPTWLESLFSLRVLRRLTTIGVDIRLLQAAIAVAEELNFSRAAARLTSLNLL